MRPDEKKQAEIARRNRARVEAARRERMRRQRQRRRLEAAERRQYERTLVRSLRLEWAQRRAHAAAEAKLAEKRIELDLRRARRSRGGRR